MIQCPEGQDRGKFLYQKYPDQVKNYCLSFKQSWFQSKTYKGLRNRCILMDQMIDGVYKNSAGFISDVVPSVIRKGYKEFSAIYHKFLEQDPIATLSGNTNIPQQVVSDQQAVLNDNYDRSYWREKCLAPYIDLQVRHGCCGLYTFATDDSRASSLMTIVSDDGMGDIRQQMGNKQNIVVTTPIHALNVIADPRQNWMVEPIGTGFIGDIALSTLRTLQDNPEYIGENIKYVLHECKDGQRDKNYYSGQQGDDSKDYSKGHANISYFWLTLPITGNEDDSTWYCVEIVNEEIIHISENSLDYNTIPISLCSLIQRPYNWTGNTPLEDKIAIQNMMIWLINTEIESTMKLTDRLVLVRDGELDVNAINNRHRTGGIVPYKGQEQDLSKLVYSPQFGDASFRNVDWLVREMRQEDQESSPIVNLQNKYNSGGMNNSTLGAAQMTAGIGEMLTGLQINQLVKGIKQATLNTLTIMKSLVTSDGFKTGDGRHVPPRHMVPQLNVTIKTSNVYSYSRDVQDCTNQLSQVVNYKATKIPEFNAIKLRPMIERLIRAYAKREDVGEYIEESVFTTIEQQLANPQPSQPSQPPPPSLSISLGDLTFNERAQALAQRGIQADQVGMQQPQQTLPQGGM